MKHVLPLLTIFLLAIILSSCSSGLVLSKKHDKSTSDGAIAYQPLEQPVPEVKDENERAGLSEDNALARTANNGIKVLNKLTDFTKSIAATSFNRLAPDRNTASSNSAKDITIGQIVIVLAIVLLLALLLAGNLDKVINLLISILVLILLILLILWLLGRL